MTQRGNNKFLAIVEIVAMKVDETTKALLYRDWTHSHEEDEGNKMIYRPSTFDFPLSRGRMEIRLGANGSCTFLDIARGDGSESKTCTLSENSDALKIVIDYPEGWVRTLQVVSVDEEKLVVVETF